MSRRQLHDDWEDEDSSWDDAEGDDDGTMPCPYCKRPIYEDVPRCPYCERYILDEDASAPRKPWWIIVGFLLCFYVVYRWIRW